MRKIFSLLAFLFVAVPVQAQGTATVAETTSLFDAASLRGTQALFAGTRLDVNGCVRQAGRPYYQARVSATGSQGLVPPEHVRWSSGRTVRCDASVRPTVVTRYAAGPVALYAGPGQTFEIVGGLKAGEAVRVSCAAGWCEVFGGTHARPTPADRIGFLPERLLTEEESEP
ncbi:MAG TPA: hypothetical protein VD948_09595 [Rhodothermales bacterium]|nr:hypothetical protein [Rhodothermales bacterium]